MAVMSDEGSEYSGKDGFEVLFYDDQFVTENSLSRECRALQRGVQKKDDEKKLFKRIIMNNSTKTIWGVFC
jgi:hypothetical protein